MSLANFFNIFLIISALHGFVFSIILFFSKHGRDKSMLFLNLIILSISLNNLQSCIYDYTITSVNYFEVPWHFLGAPFFYIFVTHYLDIHEKSIKILKTTIIVFSLMCITQLIFVLSFKNEGSNDYLNYIFEKYRSFEEAISFLSSVSLFGYSFYILYKKEKLFPKILMYDNLKWLHTFFKLIIFVYIFWVLALFIRFKLNFTGFVFSYYPLRIFTTFVIYLLGYQAVLHLRILKERKHIRENIHQEKAEETVKEKQTINTNKTEKQFDEIDTYIKSNKKFLQPKYSLKSLASDMKIGASTLSVIINNNANQSFIDYINNMRIAQAKKLLVNEKYANYTIVSIGLESGFNSKSTFYNVFKKHVGHTPLEYKSIKTSKTSTNLS